MARAARIPRHWNKSAPSIAQYSYELRRKEPIPIHTEIYELISLIARYWFALLIVLFVARAWRITIVDNRRARTLRSIATSTGQLGEMVVTKGSGKARRGMKYPILQEGMIGASARADIRIRAVGVKKRHAHFKLRPDGLLLTAIGDSPLAFADGNKGKKLLATDGDTLVIGSVHLLVVLFDGQTDQVHDRVNAPAQPERYDQYDFDDIPAYDPNGLDDPFMLNQEDPWQEQKPTQKRSRKR